MPALSIRLVLRRRQTGALALLCSLAGRAVLPAQQLARSVIVPRLASAAAPLVIRNVTVVDVETGQRIPDRTVIIAERLIQAVSAGVVALPSRASVVDGRGKFLIPGLWDMHTHVGLWNPDARAFYMAPGIFPALLADGVTGIRDVGLKGMSVDTLLRWRQEITSGARIGPRMVVTGAMITSNDPNPWALNVKTPEAARHAVDSLKVAGVDFIKIHDESMPREVYFAVAVESRRVGLPFIGHMPMGVTLAEASDSGQRSIEHVGMIRSSCWGPAAEPGGTPDAEESDAAQFLLLSRPHSDTTVTDDAECAARAAQFRRNGTWLTPTLGILYAYFGNEAGDDGKRLVRESYRFGIPMLAGTDLAQPPALTDELKLLVDAGMTTLDALRAATLNPAKALQASDSLGTVAAGKVADLVVLDADPLQDITNTTRIRAVVANGRYYDRIALDSLLAQARRASAAMRPDTTGASP